MERKSVEKRAHASLHSLKSPLQSHPSLTKLKKGEHFRLPSAHDSRMKPIAHNNFKIDRNNVSFYGSEEREQWLKIQNMGRDPIKLSITVPKTMYFMIKEKHRTLNLSAGMSKKVPVTLGNIPKDISCLDYVHIQGQSKSIVNIEQS